MTGSTPATGRGSRLTLVTTGAAPPRRGRLHPAAVLVSVAAATAIIVGGLAVVPGLRTTGGHPGLQPAERSIVAVGSMDCPSGPRCASDAMTAVVDALDPALVLPVGSLARSDGAGLGADTSDRTWQRVAPRLRPVTDQGPAYYSYDYGNWHLVALNGNCAAVGGCGPGSPQERWLAADLRHATARCTLAYWNKPRFSSMHTGDDQAFATFWQELYDAGAEIVINGDAGGYERFARQSPTGDLDVERGLRQFVVGSAAPDSASFRDPPSPRSVVRNGRVPGVLQLVIESNGYRWQFVPVLGQRFRDNGKGACH
jgi:hypothetical protein